LSLGARGPSDGVARLRHDYVDCAVVDGERNCGAIYGHGCAVPEKRRTVPQSAGETLSGMIEARGLAAVTQHDVGVPVGCPAVRLKYYVVPSITATKLPRRLEELEEFTHGVVIVRPC